MNAYRIARMILLTAPAAWLSLAAAAQTPAPQEAVAPTPTATPTPAPDAPPADAIPIPPAPVIALPSVTPTPEPTPSPTRRATPVPVAIPRGTPTPAAQRATPEASPSPAPTAALAPTPTATGDATPIAGDEEGIDWLPWLAGGAGVVLLVLLWLRYQRETPADPEVGVADAAPAAAPPPLRAAVPGPWLSVTLRPVRAGLNMVTAVADCEITVTNGGNAPADAIRSALILIAAHAGQSADIDAANAEPITRPAVPAFTLAPGETRVFRAVAASKIETLPTMRVGEQGGGREMLVPLVILNLQHRDAKGGEHRTSQAFVLGVERVDSPKLAPFWLDSIRMIEQVAARTNGATLRRRLS